MISDVAFDADDTILHSEGHYRAAHDVFEQILGAYIDLGNADVHAHLLAVERRNIQCFGYGAKGMTLSMVESAIAITDARIAASDIQRIVDLGHAVLEHPVELLPGITEAVAKIARSGLSAWFHRIEIVSEKDTSTYRRVLDIGGHAVYMPYHVNWAMEADAGFDAASPRFRQVTQASEIAAAVASLMGSMRA